MKTKNFFKTIISLFIFGVLTFSLPQPSQAAASFGISGTRTLNAGQTFTTTISANRNLTSNAVTLNVNFGSFTYVSASVAGGWTTVSGPSRSGSTVSYAGALLGTTFTGARNVITLTLRAPSTPGTATISVSGQVSGDGANTGNESGSGSATYTIKTAPTAVPTAAPTPTPKPGPGAVTISSPSHSDQNIWYKSNSPILTWTKEAGVTDFSYILDDQASTNPDDTSEGGEITKSYTNQGDGTFYFHIKAKNEIGWGPASHYKLNIDSSEPDPFTITAVKSENSDEYKIYFATSDQSGIVSYRVFADDEDLGLKTSGFDVPSGKKSVKVVATDQAGNVKEASLDLETEAIDEEGEPAPVTTSSSNSNTTWLWVLGIISLLLLIYAIVMTALFVREKGGLKNLNKKKSENSPTQDFGSLK
jgi:hypothetical protein